MMAALLSVGITMSSSEKMEGPEIVLSISPDIKGADFPSQEKLGEIAREIVRKLFPDDLKKSKSAKGELTWVGRDDGRFRFALFCLFLYRETYTAKTHRVLFSFSGKAYTVLSVDEKPWENPGDKSK